MLPSVVEMTDVRIRPFRIEVPRADVDGLRARLLHTRWPDEPPDAGCDYGLPLGDAGPVQRAQARCQSDADPGIEGSDCCTIR
jgi:hypothetical protein